MARRRREGRGGVGRANCAVPNLLRPSPTLLAVGAPLIGANIRGLCSLSPQRGERVGVRGAGHRGGLADEKVPVGEAQTCGEAPSPSLASLARPLPPSGGGLKAGPASAQFGPMGG